MATRGRHRSDLAGLCDEYLNNVCAALQETRITWMGACVPTPGMLIWTIVWKEEECFSILTETHACNPSCLVTTFDSFLNPSPPPASISLRRISIAYEQITEWHYFFHPSSPLLQFLPSHTEESCQSFSAFHLPQRFCPYFFCASFQSLSRYQTFVCYSLSSHNTNTH